MDMLLTLARRAPRLQQLHVSFHSHSTADLAADGSVWHGQRRRWLENATHVRRVWFETANKTLFCIER